MAEERDYELDPLAVEQSAQLINEFGNELKRQQLEAKRNGRLIPMRIDRRSHSEWMKISNPWPPSINKHPLDRSVFVPT